MENLTRAFSGGSPGAALQPEGIVPRNGAGGHHTLALANRPGEQRWEEEGEDVHL